MAVLVNVSNIGAGFNRTPINNNFTDIQEALQDALSRSGNGPNQMEADIDLNSNDLLNVGALDVETLTVAGEEFVPEGVTAVGPPGDSATITVGTVTTGAAGTDVIVTNVGDEVDAILNFTIPRGNTGASGAGSGDMVAAQNLNDVADKPTAFANIKQAATESATGVVELATSAEVQALSDTTRVVTPAGLGSVGFAQLDLEDQVATGGARITPKNLGNLSGASITPDPGDRGIQYITNNGAGSILPGSNEGTYLLLVLNTTGAGAITTTGWITDGDSFDTTTTSKFLCSCLVTTNLKVMQIKKWL
jgi:hypothetical protein